MTEDYADGMETLSPKQREIRERESRILELARPMVAGGGLAMLSMEAIAAELKTAKGTIYNHFPNKEEIVLALAIQAAETRLQLFNHAALMRGRPRERIQAIGIASEVFADRYTELLRIEQIIRHDAVWDKTSPRRQEVLRMCESRCIHLVAGVVRDGVACGDLACEDSHSIEDIVFGLWSIMYGSMLLEMSSPSLKEIGIADSRIAIRRNCNAMLDGLKWQPLFHPTNYSRWIGKVQEEFKKMHSPEGKASQK